MPKNLYILTKLFFLTLDDISLQNVIAHPDEDLFSFLMFNNSILLTKNLKKKQTQWSYKMSWPLKTLTK